jgi:thiosulfate/3-mercaptopyruvate sulfurtransferase
MQRITRWISTTAAALIGTVVLTAAQAGPEVTPLVDSQWLKAHLNNDQVVVVDVRSAIDGTDAAGFANQHIPGSVYASYTQAGWRVAADGVPGKVPPISDLETLIGALGIDNDDTVVVVPAGVGSTDFGSAARVYWTFKYLGHDDVAILNGGLGGWIESGGSTANDPVAVEAATFKAQPQPDLLADTPAVEAAIDAGDQLVDARPADQYSGQSKHPAALSAGTIPGAASLEERLLVTEGTATFIDRTEVDRLVDVAGIETDQPIISFCNTGHWAATSWFALSEVAELDNVSLYDGSMTEWTQDTSRPVALAQRALSTLLGN